MVLTKEEIGKYIEAEWEEKRDEVYAEVKNDVANQILAVFFLTMHKDFGFGKKRLLKVKEGVECYFHMMQTSIKNASMYRQSASKSEAFFKSSQTNVARKFNLMYISWIKPI